MANVEDVALSVAKLESQTEDNTRRIEALESKSEAINRLATATELMAQEQKRLGACIEQLTSKVAALESEPAKRWRLLVEKAITVVLAAILGFVLAHIGL